MNGQTSRERMRVFAFTLWMLGTGVQARTIDIDAEGTGDYPTIRAAIEAAQSGDTIVLEPGLYVNFGNQDITMVDKVLTLKSRDPNDPAVVADTVIDCQGDRVSWSTHWFIGAQGGGDTHLTLAGLTVVHAFEVGSGGAVRCEEADLDVINCTFRDNASQIPGGAVYCHNDHARFAGCTFTNSTSDVEHGGAVYSIGSQLEFVSCSFQASTGCALETYDCRVTLTNCTFTNNRGRDGGAIRCQGDTTPETTSLTLTGCTFVGNSSSTHGGAVYLYNTKTATISACTFRTNQADEDGGALYNYYQASPTVVSCLFVENTAAGNGGAIQNLANSSPSVLNCTLVANTAGNGGAVAALGGSSPVISQSILWGNTATQGNSVYLGTWVWSLPPTATATVRFCDVEGGRSSAFTEPDCGLTWDSAGNIVGDPLFVAPATADYHLPLESPCINAGDPAYVPDSGQTDLDGRARRSGPAVDLGAYEFPITYTLTVNHGSGGGQYPDGHVQMISADPAPDGKRFDRWTGDAQHVTNVNQANTTVTMPAASVILTATYIDARIEGINVALQTRGGIATADSEGADQGATNYARYADDRDEATNWCNSLNMPAWLKIEFDRIYIVSQVAVIWGQHNQTYSISLSEDGTNWTPVVASRPSNTNARYEGSAYIGNTNLERELFDITPQNAKFIRMDITETSAPTDQVFKATLRELEAYSSTGLLHDWNGDGIVSIIGDVPPFVQCVYFNNCPGGVDPLGVGDCNHDGILSIIGDVPCFVQCVYFGNCPE